MRDALGPGTILGYGTNVHAGTSLDAIRANLSTYALDVKKRVSPSAPMGIGLWLPEMAARTLAEPGERDEFRASLDERGLEVFTLNGFPQRDFHEPVVKHRVYTPDWTDPARLAYTIELLAIIAALRPAGGEGSVSTLPLAWSLDDAGATWAAVHLREAAAAAARITDETGVLVHVDLEPEPGCVLDHADDVVAFFQEHLFRGADDERCRRHLRVCHDVCHASVMFEEQHEVLDRYRQAGIAVGKVQLSNAIEALFDDVADGDVSALRAELAAFREDRYLHQTTCRVAGTSPSFQKDLPLALADAGPHPTGTWRVHFHVPLYLEQLGEHLRTTRADVAACLDALAGRDEVSHYEVETYAWTVLPPHLLPSALDEGIAAELTWVRHHAAERTT